MYYKVKTAKNSCNVRVEKRKKVHRAFIANIGPCVGISQEVSSRWGTPPDYGHLFLHTVISGLGCDIVLVIPLIKGIPFVILFSAASALLSSVFVVKVTDPYSQADHVLIFLVCLVVLVLLTCMMNKLSLYAQRNIVVDFCSAVSASVFVIQNPKAMSKTAV